MAQVSYTVKVKVNTHLNVRKGPGKDRDIVAKLNNGDKVKIVEEVDGWGKLENGNWISLKYTEKV